MRRRDWAKRLGIVLQAAVGRELVWGEYDCFVYAGLVAQALTGVDPTAPLRGRYDSYAAGLRAARAQFGVTGLRGFADAHYAQIPVALAQRGDWALVRTSEGLGLAIVDGSNLRDATGRLAPLAEARLCWRVE